MKKAPPKGSTADRDEVPGLRIRAVTQADRTTWIELRRQLWPDEPAEDLAQDADKLLQSQGGGGFSRWSMPAMVLFAESPSKQIVGFAEVNLRPYADGCRSSPVGYLEAWYVVPEYRRRSIGRALVLGAEAWAIEQGCTEMASDTELANTGSRRAHRALGYDEVVRIVQFRRGLNKAQRPQM